jgi:signal transduction histidine kinase
MPPLYISFTGYAIVGLTQFIMATTIVVSLLRLPSKSSATRLLTVFFAAIAASGAAMILSNGLPFWDRAFDPWQDTFVLLGGVALTQFAYRFPQPDQPREAKLVLWLMGGLALLSVAYSLAFDFRFIFQWTPDLDISDVFHAFMPIGTVLAFVFFLRRSTHFSALTWIAIQDPVGRRPSIWRRLLHPLGQEALVLRSFALALLLGLLPGLAALLPLPRLLGFLMMNLGSLLAMAAIALIYFNYTPEMTSFMAKLVGVTLVTVLLSLSVVGSIDYRQLSDDYFVRRMAAIAAARSLLMAGRTDSMLPQIAYVVSWETETPDLTSSYQTLYARPNVANFNLDRLIAENRQGYLDRQATPISREVAQMIGAAGQRLLRYGSFPEGSTQPDFESYLFTGDDATIEIAQAQADLNIFLNETALKWMMWIIVSSLFVLIFFPLFFKRMLVNPLVRLLGGVSEVIQGDLNTTVPIQYHDEIGSLTGSFNALTRTLKESYEILEHRVTDRTRELAAFSDLTMLTMSDDDLHDVLQPALHRILEAGKCEALSLHLMNPDGQTLELGAYLYLPETAHNQQQTIEATDGFTARLQHADTPLIFTQPVLPADVPAAFSIPQFQSYLGCPLTAGGQALGWLSCYRVADTGFGMSEASFLVALARQVGVIIENHRLRARSSQIAVVEERQRLARELHDAVTQALYSQLLFARAGRDALEEDDRVKLRDSLQQVESNAILALKEMRLLLYQLRPAALQHGHLIEAINERFDLVERRLGLQATCAMDDDVSLSPDLEDMLYRVTLEALNNVVKHANASAVQVYLCRDHIRLYLSIQDDGRSFAVEHARGGMGLSNMQARVTEFGGQLEFVAQPERGTEVRISVPLPGNDEGATDE